MKTALQTPDGKTTYPSDGMLPSIVRIEECPYRKHNPDGILHLQQMGRSYADSLFNHSDLSNLDQATRAVADPSATLTTQGLQENSESTMNFGEHRAGVITAFDPRTIKLLHPTTPAFFGTKSKLVKQIAALADDAPMTPTRARHSKKLQPGGEIVGLGVEHIDKLLKESKNGGLHYAFHAYCSEEGLGPPLDRITFFRW